MEKYNTIYWCKNIIGCDEVVKRKYITEFALSASGSYTVVLQQEHLEKLANGPFNKKQPCHIYMIARRPRIMFDPSTIVIEKGAISGDVKVQRQAIQETHHIQVQHHLGKNNLRIECKFPYTEYTVYDEHGTDISFGKVAVLLTMSGHEYADLLDLEILYVGQSYGVEGARTAPERLQSHSTLQKIYGEAMRLSPDQDIWLLLWSFELTLLTSIDGTFTPTHEQIIVDDPHVEQVFKKRITEQQQVNFTEAALIKYFRPQYNTMFKDTFPSSAHSTYSECYDLDINSVGIILDTENINTRIWSPQVHPQWSHYHNFLLHSSLDRKSIFDI